MKNVLTTNIKLNSIKSTRDTHTTDGVLTRNISDGESVVGVVAVNTTNYPTAKNTGSFINILTAGGYEIGIVGTDSTSGDGTLYYELNTPVVTQEDITITDQDGETVDFLKGFEDGTIYQNDIPALLTLKPQIAVTVDKAKLKIRPTPTKQMYLR